MDPMIRNAIDYINEHRQDMLKLWEEIVNMESGHTQKAGVDAVCRRLAEEMEAAGISTRTIPMEKAGNFLVGEWGMERPHKPVLLVGHMDTVFTEGAAKTNPFRIENGLAYGPGVLDMKAGLVMALYILKALAHVGYDVRPIKLAFAGDEEVLHMHSNAREVFAEECKGIGFALNFETGYLDNSLVVGRKGGMYFSIEVEGVGAHSGIAPEKGRSAVEEMSYKIIEMQNINDFERGALVNAAIVSGGTAENIIPNRCTLKGSFRFPSSAIKNEILERLKQIANTQHVDGTSAVFLPSTTVDCMETTPEVMKLFNRIRDTAEKYGFGEVHPLQVGGVSDSSIISTLGIPVVCGLGVKGEWNHTVNEYAVVDSLFERAQLALATILEMNTEFDD